MRTIGNILWLVLAGFWLAVGYAIAGIVLCITVIGIPFGVQSFKLAGYSLWPFGRVVVTGILLLLTIIGIPLGVANFKLALLALVPFGKTVVPIDHVAGRDVWMRGPEPVG